MGIVSTVEILNTIYKIAALNQLNFELIYRYIQHFSLKEINFYLWYMQCIWFYFLLFYLSKTCYCLFWLPFMISSFTRWNFKERPRRAYNHLAKIGVSRRKRVCGRVVFDCFCWPEITIFHLFGSFANISRCWLPSWGWFIVQFRKVDFWNVDVLGRNWDLFLSQ